MKLVSLRCPNCGSALQCEEGTTTMYCQYCGTPVFVDDESINIKITRDTTERYIDEAQLKAVELEKQKYEGQQQRYETDQAKEDEWKKLVLLWIAAMAITYFFYSIVRDVAFLSTVATGLFGVAFLFGGIGVAVMKPRTENSQKPRQVRQVVRVREEYDYVSYKSRGTAFILCFFLGFFGAHQFYAGKTGMGILYLFTAGLFGLGWLYDMVIIAMGKFRDNRGRRIV